MSLNWKSKLAIQRFKDIKKSLGHPDWFNCRGSGWELKSMKKHNLIFSYIRIMDEEVTQNTPAYHCNALTIGLKVNIPLEYLDKIIRISDSIYYDRLKQTLVARSHFIGASVASLRLALETIYYDYNDDYNDDFLDKKYKEYIMDSMKPDGLSRQYKELKSLLYSTLYNFPLVNNSICDYTRFELEPVLDEINVLKSC